MKKPRPHGYGSTGLCFLISFPVHRCGALRAYWGPTIRGWLQPLQALCSPSLPLSTATHRAQPPASPQPAARPAPTMGEAGGRAEVGWASRVVWMVGGPAPGRGRGVSGPPVSLPGAQGHTGTGEGAAFQVPAPVSLEQEGLVSL